MCSEEDIFVGKLHPPELSYHVEHGNVSQEFGLGVEPEPLTVNLVKQNPEPLPELLSNYDELFEAYRYSKHAWMFD